MIDEFEKRQAAERTRAAARRRPGEMAAFRWKCAKCGYEATWLPAENGSSPALDMNNKCPEVTARLDRAQNVGRDPRLCRKLRAAWW